MNADRYNGMDGCRTNKVDERQIDEGIDLFLPSSLPPATYLFMNGWLVSYLGDLVFFTFYFPSLSFALSLSFSIDCLPNN